MRKTVEMTLALLLISISIFVTQVPSTAHAQEPPCNFTYNNNCYADLGSAEDAMRLSSAWNVFMTLKQIDGNRRTYHLPPKPTMPNPAWITRTVDDYVWGWRGDDSPKFATQADTFEWAKVAARRLFAPGLSSVKSAYISDDLLLRGTQTDVNGFQHFYYSHNYTRVPILEIDLTQVWPVHWACSYFTPGVEGARVSSYFHSVQISDQAPTPGVYYIAGQGCGTFNGARFYMIAMPVLDVRQTPNSALCQAPYSHNGTECVSDNEAYIYDTTPEYVLEPAEQPCPAKSDNETNPCDPANGNKSQTEVDYAASGAGSLAFKRFYSSMGAYRSGINMAPGWRHSYSSTMNETPDKEPTRVFISSPTQSAAYSTPAEACSSGWGDIKNTAFSGDLSVGVASYAGDNTCDITIGGTKKAYLRIRSNFGGPVLVAQNYKNITRASGATHRFELENGVWVNKLNASLKLEESGGNFVFTDTNDTKESFNASGQLVSITYRNGQTETLEYNLTSAQGGDDNGNTLDRVTGPFGHAITFTYDTNGRLASVVTPTGAFQYAYDTNGNLETVSYPDATVREYHYEDATFTDYLTGITDEKSDRFATWSYDAEGRAITSEHAGGKESVQLAYNSDGSTTLTTGNGATRNYIYSTQQGSRKLALLTGDVCSTCPGGNIRSRTHDADGFLDEVLDWNGNTTQTIRNGRGLTETLIEAKGSTEQRTTTTIWHPTLRLPTKITSPKNVTDITYDANGNVLAMTVSSGALSPAWAMTYNANGQPLTIDGPHTDVSDLTTIEYYTCTAGTECGQIHTITNALSHVTTFNSYDAAGRPKLMTDANGLQTSFTYDWRGNVLTMTETPVSGTPRMTFMTYDDVGQLETLGTANGMVLTYVYSAAHYLTSITDNLGNRIDYNYDAMGNLIDEDTYDQGSTLKRAIDYAYDLNNRLDAVTNGGFLTDLTIDLVGNLTNELDPSSAFTQHSYDALNRLDKTTDALTGIIDYDYDDHDNITLVTAPNGAATSFEYDNLDNLTKEISPDRGTLTYTYDEAGNRKTTLDARGKLTSYDYDALNRLILVTFDDGATISYEYDVGSNAIGRLNKITDSSGTTTWTYDNFGAVTQKVQTIGAVVLAVGYTYYPNGQVQSMTLPSNRVVTYGYNTYQRDSVNVDATPILYGATYEPFGAVNGWTWGNSSTNTREFDLRGLLESQTLLNDTRNLGYDSVGRLSSVEEIGYGPAFDFDDIVPGDVTLTSAITPNTNRLATTQGPTAKTFAYDASGNTTSDGIHSYGYDDRGRLTTVDSGTTAVYVHNGQGQRVKKDDGAVTTLFVYDDAGNLIGEYDQLGSAVEHVWFSGEPVAVLAGAGVYYVHTDHLGTPRIVSNGSSAIWSWQSSPFSLGTADEDPDNDLIGFTYNLRFPGQYYDSETELHYNYYRTYDPSTGRYMESDPISLAAGLNTYSYVSNMPTMQTDTFGLANDNSIYTGLPFDQQQALREHRQRARPPRKPCKVPFSQRALDRFAETNRALPGMLAPIGLGALTAGRLGQVTGAPTTLQALQTLRTGQFVTGAAHLTRLEAMVGASGLSLVNAAMVGAAFEGGVAVGSLIGAAILPCEEAEENECSK